MRRANITLASNAAAGTSAAAYWYGGLGHFVADATWGGGSAKLQYKTLNGTWVDYPSGSMTATGLISFTLPPCEIRTITATGSAFYVFAMPI